MKRSLILLTNIIVFVESLPSPVDGPLSQAAYSDAEKNKNEGVNTATYESYGPPPDFYNALIPSLSGYDQIPYFYYDNASYIPFMPDEEKGCTWVNNCPNNPSDPFAPTYGDSAEETDGSYFREWKCHVETNCYQVDKIPTDIHNKTEVLFLRNFNTTVLREGVLSTLVSQLLKLHIEFGNLETLEPGVFKHQRNLQYLELVGNFIETLQPLTFQELENLQALEVTDNRLLKVERNVFKGLKSLTVLKLGGNKLAAIDDDVFREMPLLEEIHMEDNNISTLSRHAFRGLPKLIALYLGQNSLRKIPSSALRELSSLKILHLTGNPLRRIYKMDFNRLDSLREIRLDQCDIEVISRKAFRGKNITYLDISENKLTKLDNLGYVGQHSSLLMAFNPWMCNCSLTATTNWIRKYNITVLLPPPRCFAPYHLKIRQIMDLTNKLLCDPTAGPGKVPRLNYPDKDETPLPEGGWSDQVYDIEKLYPQIHQTLGNAPLETTTGRGGNSTINQPGYAEQDITTHHAYDEFTKAVDQLGTTSGKSSKDNTSNFAGDTTSATTIIYVRLPSDSMRMIMIILGISVPTFLIAVLILYISLRKKGTNEKADIEMPYIDAKTDEPVESKKGLLNSGEEEPEVHMEPTLPNQTPAEILDSQQTMNKNVMYKIGESSASEMPMSANAAKVIDISQREQSGTAKIDKTNEENIEHLRNSEQSYNK